MTQPTVDVAWLSGVLGRTVADFSVEHIGRFTNRIDRLHVRFLDGSTQRLILKQPDPLTHTRVAESAELEARCLRALAAHLPVPTCLAWEDPLLLLEEVEPAPFSWQAGASPRHLRNALQALRALHQHPAPDWVPAFSEPALVTALHNEFTRAWSRHRARFDRLFPAFTPVGDHVAGQGASRLGDLDHPRQWLHGDAHLENLPEARDGRGVFMLDWAGPRAGHPLFDVACFLVMSLPPVRRQAEEADWLAWYLQHEPTAKDLSIYATAVATRAASIVELTASWHEERFDAPGFHWVFERCLTAAVEHARDV